MGNPRGSSPLFNLVAIIAVVAALALAKEILLPIALAVLLSFLLTPLANRFERWGLPRIPTVILVVAIAFAPLGLLGWIVSDQLVETTRALPSYRATFVTNITSKIRSIRPSSTTLDTVGKTMEDLGNELTNGDKNERESNNDSNESDPSKSNAPAPGQDSRLAPLPSARAGGQDLADSTLTDATKAAAPEQSPDAVPVKVVEISSPLAQVRDWLGTLAAPLTTAGMVVVMVVFMLLDRESQRNRLIQLFGKSNLHVTTEAFHDAAQRVGSYLRMLFIINLGYGIAVAVGLWAIGVPSAIMWGFLGFALRFLPYLGPWLAAFLPILVSLAVTDGWTQPLLVIGMYVIYELVLNNVVEPLLYGNSIGVSAVGVILAAIFWTWIWGPIGLVLAMPMTVCLVVMSRYVPPLRFIHVLLADQPALSPSERLYQRLLAFDYHEPFKVARTHLKSSSQLSFYDNVLIPALVLAEQDRHAGVLNVDQEEFLHQAAAELVEDMESVADDNRSIASEEEAKTPGPVQGVDRSSARILCVPLRDQADEIATKMLAQLLEAEGYQIDTDAAGALASEVVDHVAKLASDVVVISILPPIAPRDSRLLWKRLRSRYPELPIIVGFWNNALVAEALIPPDHDSATKVVTTLADALALIRSQVAQVESAAKPPHLSPPTASA